MGLITWSKRPKAETRKPDQNIYKVAVRYRADTVCLYVERHTDVRCYEGARKHAYGRASNVTDPIYPNKPLLRSERWNVVNAGPRLELCPVQLTRTVKQLHDDIHIRTA